MDYLGGKLLEATYILFVVFAIYCSAFTEHALEHVVQTVLGNPSNLSLSE